MKVPLITGSTSQRKRDELFEKFKAGEVRVLAVSKVANFAVDLPDAAVAIQVSGTFGSRQEEAQRLGRILRPKPGLFQTYARTIVFSSYCLDPVPLWKAEGQLVITCRDARGIEMRQTNYRDVKITYALGDIASRNARRASQ